MKSLNLSELVTATHTPFHEDGSLNLAVVEDQAAHLAARGIRTVFIGGSTGESHSLSLEERLHLARRWMEVVPGTDLRVIVHVGSNCLTDAAVLAREAQALGVLAISAQAPSYFKPSRVALLVECCAQIAAAAPDLPFYYYDIPALTGVTLSMPEFLVRARERIPSLAGIKYTNPDLVALQECLEVAGQELDILWGTDEFLLAALALGVKGAVGSTYNFAAPLALEIVRAFEAADLPRAREAQWKLVKLIRLLAAHGYLAAAKALMKMLGVAVGPVRLPLERLSGDQVGPLREELEQLGYFEWIAR